MRNKASFQLNININAIKTAKTRFPISVFHIWCRLTVVSILFEELISSHDCDKTWIDKFQLLRLLWHDWCLKLSIKLWPEVIICFFHYSFKSFIFFPSPQLLLSFSNHVFDLMHCYYQCHIFKVLQYNTIS